MLSAFPCLLSVQVARLDHRRALDEATIEEQGRLAEAAAVDRAQADRELADWEPTYQVCPGRRIR